LIITNDILKREVIDSAEALAAKEQCQKINKKIEREKNKNSQQKSKDIAEDGIDSITSSITGKPVEEENKEVIS
jgi:hypothetical protein